MVDVICPPLSISSIVVSLWLAGCLAESTLIGWREYYGGGGVGVDDTCVEPSKREDLTQCYFNIGPPPTALDQHWNNIGSSPRVCWESCPHFDTRVPSVSGWNRLHNALCNILYTLTNIITYSILTYFIHRTFWPGTAWTLEPYIGDYVFHQVSNQINITGNDKPYR